MSSRQRHAFVFPGQGSQRVGMGKGFAERYPAARQTFEEADGALGFSLSQLCWQGPEEDLQLTANTQPAILTTSIAIYKVLAERAGEALKPEVMGGHSLGEYSALVAAGALELGEAVRLVHRRGQLMQEAVPVGMGAMAAILGLDSTEVREVAAQVGRELPDQECVVANLNAPGQTVLAGHKQAVERAAELAKAKGARRAVLLSVSAPFHSPLMEPARQGMEPLLAAAGLEDPRVPVVSNVDARPVRTAVQARDALVRQIERPVRWEESVRWMAEEGRVSSFVELGAGRVLSGLIRRIVPGAKTASLAEPEALDELLGNES